MKKIKLSVAELYLTKSIIKIQDKEREAIKMKKSSIKKAEALIRNVEKEMGPIPPRVKVIMVMKLAEQIDKVPKGSTITIDVGNNRTEKRFYGKSYC